MFRHLPLLTTLLLPFAANATTAVPVSEPATLGLLAIGAAAVLAIRTRKK
jgi:hypothetical protein